MPHFPGTISSKLPNVGTTIFTVMSKLAAEHNAINLSQGFPDFDCAPELRELLTKFVNSGLNQYPPMAGVAPLREAIAEKVETLYGAVYDPEHEVTVVPGATYGIFTAIAAMVRPGDEVILFEPAYDSYAPAVEVNGGKPVYVQLKFPDYSIDWREVQRCATNCNRSVCREIRCNSTRPTRAFRFPPKPAI
jgi:methionine aminotransferase